MFNFGEATVSSRDGPAPVSSNAGPAPVSSKVGPAPVSSRPGPANFKLLFCIKELDGIEQSNDTSFIAVPFMKDAFKAEVSRRVDTSPPPISLEISVVFPCKLWLKLFPILLSFWVFETLPFDIEVSCGNRPAPF